MVHHVFIFGGAFDVRAFLRDLPWIVGGLALVVAAVMARRVYKRKKAARQYWDEQAQQAHASRDVLFALKHVAARMRWQEARSFLVPEAKPYADEWKDEYCFYYCNEATRGADLWCWKLEYLATAWFTSRKRVMASLMELHRCEHGGRERSREILREVGIPDEFLVVPFRNTLVELA